VPIRFPGNNDLVAVRVAHHSGPPPALFPVEGVAVTGGIRAQINRRFEGFEFRIEHFFFLLPGAA
jgi:hypothetical protein